jgi:hypothetical protein
MYLRALLGEQSDQSLAHFGRKLEEARGEESGTGPAQVLVTLLARLGRYAEAIDVAQEHLGGVLPSQLTCPTVVQLCQMAGDAERLQTVARGQGDILSFLAGALQTRA